MKLSRRLVPDVTTLQAFECAARHGSFTQAAAELNLTQSAVSRQIKDLENQLGVLLFERVRQRVILSDAGQKFLPEVRRLLNQTEELMVRAMASARADSTLSIASLPTFGSRWLVPRLPDFLKRHPDTVLNIASRSAPFDFDEQNFDLAIHYGQPVWARATCSYLCSEIIVPAASPALLANHPIETPEDLVAGPLLHLATRPKLWAQWFEANDMDGRGAYRGNRFDQFSMVIEAATAGLGFALLPRYLIEQEIAAGTLSIVLDRPMKTENSYYLAVPEGKLENPISLAFREWITEQVG
ncbi:MULTISPECIES: LysR family transcriptional regulator [Sinorhizobium/Ensifer group]|jgi:LysR family glycine cleavage system transcriptional activator|uniref:LysR family transcriptional regulator n=1 Tax=Sinorhizobium/Ensifer group TaxID=227292 RepID=UPI00070EDEEC|nr:MULTISPECIES: LysR family transcriptional regulator [Sinorhizobium/Ensifer group]KRD49923.1 LysR family transcriptional regulator [Ensifer sp. Root278]KSV70805.1 LysR family transcriptional regulator [Sinorhizobium sp. Sb3]KSV93536.1 LysR family transcriptional regulator [Sinorhizobium sp. GL28]MBD9509416.1 LysR family transcriptional regulator [Ensifer sp. ENS10]SDA75357.1 LysR family transcriptional regulator, glycine cleavage system transcriptional activator [Sinorhizobium sp. NFACC03]